MTDQTPPPFTPRPRSRREPVPDVSAREKIARLRVVLDRLGHVTAEMLSDSDGPVMLQVEAAINRANAIVAKLPKIVLDRLDKDMLRGLNDTRNVAAHGYAQLDPAITAEIASAHLPDFLDQLEKALDDRDSEVSS